MRASRLRYVRVSAEPLRNGGWNGGSLCKLHVLGRICQPFNPCFRFACIQPCMHCHHGTAPKLCLRPLRYARLAGPFSFRETTMALIETLLLTTALISVLCLSYLLYLIFRDSPPPD